jgi:hypothetical protein
MNIILHGRGEPLAPPGRGRDPREVWEGEEE